MYCSASNLICLSNSCAAIGGRVIFFTMTDVPDIDKATFLFLSFCSLASSLMVVTTPRPSMIDPSTIISAGSTFVPNRSTFSFPVDSLSCNILMDPDPMSSPSRYGFEPNPNTGRPFSARLVCCASANDALNLFEIRRRVQSPIPPIARWRGDQAFALPAIERGLRDIKQVTHFEGGEPP